MRLPGGFPVFLAGLFSTIAHVLAGDPVLRVEDVVAAPGSAFAVKVFLAHDVPLEGYEVSLLYDTSVLTLKEITLAGTDVERLLAPFSPEFFSPLVNPDELPGWGRGSAGVIFDYRDRLPPGEQSV